MSDHAGGPTSPVVSDALAAARDGIIGYWEIDKTEQPSEVAKLEDFPDLEYLMPETRALLFDTALLSGVTVEENAGTGATFKVRNQPVLSIERPQLQDFQEQLEHIRTHADLRTDRLAEIQVQIDDILSFFGAVHYLDPEFRNYTQELLEAVVRFCISVEMQIKHFCRSARPVHYSPKVQPLIQTPDHSTFPSGHATEAFAVAAILYRLAHDKGIANGLKPHETDPVFRMAERIAANRVVAGVHFPVDSAAGALLGLTLADHVASLGTGSGTSTVTELTFKVSTTVSEPQIFKPDSNFELSWLADAQPSETIEPPASEAFQELWRKANKEWRT